MAGSVQSATDRQAPAARGGGIDMVYIQLIQR